jgi:hypothetical protein
MARLRPSGQGQHGPPPVSPVRALGAGLAAWLTITRGWLDAAD